MSLRASWDNDSLVIESIVDDEVKIAFSVEESGDAANKIIYIERLAIDPEQRPARVVVKI